MTDSTESSAVRRLPVFLDRGQQPVARQRGDGLVGGLAVVLGPHGTQGKRVKESEQAARYSSRKLLGISLEML